MKRRTKIATAIVVVVVLLVANRFLRSWEAPLRQAAKGADRVELAPTHPADQPPFFQIAGEENVDQLLGLIEIDPWESFGRCLCYGDTALRFYRGDELLVTIAFAHGDRLKWPGGPWSAEAVLTERCQIAIPKWFKERGYPGFEEARLLDIEEDRRDKQEREDFASCFPDHVRHLVLGNTRGGDLQGDQEEGRKIASRMENPREVAIAVSKALAVSSFGMSGTGDKERRALAAAATVGDDDFLAALMQLQAEGSNLRGAARLFFWEEMGSSFESELRVDWSVRLARAVFIDGLDKDKPFVLRWLWRLDDERVRDLLHQVAAGEVGVEIDVDDVDFEEPGLRIGAMLSLAVFNDNSIRPAIESELLDAHAREEQAALAVSLALLGDAWQLEVEYFSFESYLIGFAAVRAIERNGGATEVESLVEGGFRHPWGAVRDEAGAAFDRMTGQDFSSDSGRYRRKEAAVWWKENGFNWLRERERQAP